MLVEEWNICAPNGESLMYFCTSIRLNYSSGIGTDNSVNSAINASLFDLAVILEIPIGFFFHYIISQKSTVLNLLVTSTLFVILVR